MDDPVGGDSFEAPGFRQRKLGGLCALSCLVQRCFQLPRADGLGNAERAFAGEGLGLKTDQDKQHAAGEIEDMAVEKGAALQEEKQDGNGQSCSPNPAFASAAPGPVEAENDTGGQGDEQGESRFRVIPSGKIEGRGLQDCNSGQYETLGTR